MIHCKKLFQVLRLYLTKVIDDKKIWVERKDSKKLNVDHLEVHRESKKVVNLLSGYH